MIQINGVQNRYMLERTKTLEMSYALHMLSKQGPCFHSRPHYEKLHSLTVRQITIWYEFLLLLDRVFSEQLG